MSTLRDWISEGLSLIPLDLVGLVALADLSDVARRTAVTGTSTLIDVLVLCPGFHRQQDAPNLNGGEYPICAAMTTGYVFRVENEAIVSYLQKVGRSGYLTRLTVSNRSSTLFGASMISVIAYLGGILLSVTTMVLLFLLDDLHGLAFVGVLVFVRLVNVMIIQSRAVMGWKGESEPGQRSDLIILLSQDRWVRLQGTVDDVKAVTSGQWLRELTTIESTCITFTTLVMYLNVSVAARATQEGKILLAILLFSSAGLLGLGNEYTGSLRMYGRTIKLDGQPQRYSRRLVLTEQLIKETGRSDWALRLGMAKPEDVEKFKAREGIQLDSSDKSTPNADMAKSSAETADVQVKL